MLRNAVIAKTDQFTGLFESLCDLLKSVKFTKISAFSETRYTVGTSDAQCVDISTDN